MEISYSVPTLLVSIIKQAQDIGSEARWIEHYAHCEQNPDQIADIENCILEMKQSLYTMEQWVEELKEIQ